jgi:hypothetical protein
VIGVRVNGSWPAEVGAPGARRARPGPEPVRHPAPGVTPTPGGALLRPLLQRRRLHVAGFAAVAAAQIEVLLAENHHAATWQWYDLGAEMLPDHPMLKQFETHLAMAEAMDRFMSRDRGPGKGGGKRKGRGRSAGAERPLRRPRPGCRGVAG